MRECMVVTSKQKGVTETCLQLLQSNWHECGCILLPHIYLHIHPPHVSCTPEATCGIIHLNE
jgi:hypothetical protein